MASLLDPLHVRVVFAHELEFTLLEKKNILKVCRLLAQLGPLVYHLSMGGDVGASGLFIGEAGFRVRIVIPRKFTAPHTVRRPWGTITFVSRLQMTLFFLCHEVGHRDFPVYHNAVRAKHEAMCDFNALVLLRDLADDLVPQPRVLRTAKLAT